MRKQILLVEDNPDDELLTLEALKGTDITEVFVVRDGAEALDYFFTTGKFAGETGTPKPAVVLLDLKLPKIGGIEVLKQLRGHERTRRIPVVILTSSDEEWDLIESYNNGANSYIRKPVDADAFTMVVSELGHYWTNRNLYPPR